MSAASARLVAAVAALPLRPGMRVLEIGCGPGVAARLVAARIQHGRVLGIDRSAKAVEQAIAGSQREMSAGLVEFRQAAVETFALAAGEEPYDLAFALRVGALDGRHPEIEEAALRCIVAALRKGGRLFLDGGDPLGEVRLPARASSSSPLSSSSPPRPSPSPPRRRGPRPHAP